MLAVAANAYQKRKGKPNSDRDRTLIVVKAGLFAQMMDEVAKHAAKRTTKFGMDGCGRVLHYNTAIFKAWDTIESRFDLLTEYDTIITTYSTLAKSWAMGKAVPLKADKSDPNAKELDAHQKEVEECRDALHQIHYNRVFFDDAHEVKNHLSAVFRAAIALKRDATWLVSGMPLIDKPTGSFAYFCLLGLFEPHEMRKFSSMYMKNEQQWARVAAEMQSFMIRRKTSDMFLGQEIGSLSKK